MPVAVVVIEVAIDSLAGVTVSALTCVLVTVVLVRVVVDSWAGATVSVVVSISVAVVLIGSTIDSWAGLSDNAAVGSLVDGEVKVLMLVTVPEPVGGGPVGPPPGG